MENQNKELLKVEHLKKYFNTPGGVLHAVDDVSFSIRAGETLGVVGESGCGKSTMGRAILRLHEPTSGKVYFEGNDILSYDKNKMKELRREMQIIFQDPFASLDPHMRLYDQIEELIITGQADCGFLRMPSLKGLQVYPLHLDQLKVIVPCGHPLANSDPFPVEALATEPVIQLEEGDDYEIRAAFDEMGVRPHVRYIAREDRTILSMVSNGLGISLLPELMVRHSPYPLVIDRKSVV